MNKIGVFFIHKNPAEKNKITALTRRFLRLLGEKKSALDIYIVGDRFMKKNVLSFPAPKNFPRPDIKEKFLGEIYINPSYIKKNAENFEFLLIHGILHLMGYDHKRKTDRIVMEKKETHLFSHLKK